MRKRIHSSESQKNLTCLKSYSANVTTKLTKKATQLKLLSSSKLGSVSGLSMRKKVKDSRSRFGAAGCSLAQKN